MPILFCPAKPTAQLTLKPKTRKVRSVTVNSIFSLHEIRFIPGNNSTKIETLGRLSFKMPMLTYITSKDQPCPELMLALFNNMVFGRKIKGRLSNDDSTTVCLIIIYYAIRYLDNSGVILEIVTGPIKEYLRKRNNTVRCVVTSLTEEGPTRSLRERNLELFKLRFGEPLLHNCEVMLKDITDSKRINSHIQSDPKYNYTKSYEDYKGNRTLNWRSVTGRVNIAIEMGQRTLEMTVAHCLAKIKEKTIFLGDFPDSVPAIDDLKICMEKINLRSQIIKSLKTSLEARILHPGANTNYRDFSACLIIYLCHQMVLILAETVRYCSPIIDYVLESRLQYKKMFTKAVRSLKSHENRKN
uniref:Anaphase-promoting complex subunit 2 TPR repeats domain-containing protein n=1 Tax=Glossina austeni TaxID=7395 RepID=A0A1A9VX65_GLOAU